jgi:hypothetical protein
MMSILDEINAEIREAGFDRPPVATRFRSSVSY